jgi:hypothetical protein
MPDDHRQLLLLTEHERREIERTREICRRSFRLLRESLPDKFLGHKTKEPFSKLDDEVVSPLNVKRVSD